MIGVKRRRRVFGELLQEEYRSGRVACYAYPVRVILPSHKSVWMITSHHPCSAGDDDVAECRGCIRIANHAGPVGQCMCGLQRLIMIGAQHVPFRVYQGLKQANGVGWLARLAGPAGGLMQDGQGAWIVTPGDRCAILSKGLE
jgi:hypothetical protein